MHVDSVLRLLLLVVVLLGILGAVVYTVYRTYRWLGPRRFMVVSALLIIAFFVVARTILPSEAEEFTNFSGYEVPSDARKFRYSTSGYDFFGDHDGTFSFQASEASLREIATKEFRGGFEWTESKDGMVFSLNCEPRVDKSVEGVIDLHESTLRIDYSLW